MKTPALLALLGSLAFATSVFAQKSTIEGNAMNTDGKPAANAQVRIHAEKGKTADVIAKTDAKGHFSAAGLPVGSYSVAVSVGGKIVASAQRVKTQDKQPVRLQLGGRQAAAPAPQKKKWVYVEPPTGSHMGGYQQQGQKTDDDPRYDAQNIGRMSPDQVQRLSTRVSTDRGN